MVLIRDLAIQGAQMLLVLLLAPLFTGFVRKAKARLLRRQGPPLIQPYLDLARLMRKDVVLADNASWLFRVIPYLIFAITWVAASLVPTFRTGLMFSWSADLIAIIALLGSARFFLALAGLDVGTSFGGIGSSREASLIACLFVPWGIESAGAELPALAVGVAAYVGKLAVGGFLLALFETSIAKMRVFRVPEFLGAALMLGLLATLLRFVSASF